MYRKLCEQPMRCCFAILQNAQDRHLRVDQKCRKNCLTLQAVCLGCHWHFCGNNGRQVDDPLRITPLIVVPHHDLHQVLTHDHGQSCINGVGVVCLHEVARHQWLLFEIDDALHFALLCRALLANLDHQVHNGHVWRGHPQRDAVQLALVLGQDCSDSLCGTGRGWDNVASTSACSAQVTMAAVKDHLITSVGMCGCHHAILHFEAVVKHLAHRCHAVSCARGV